MIRNIFVPNELDNKQIKKATKRLGKKNVDQIYIDLYKHYHEVEKSIQDNMFTTIEEDR